MAVYNDIINWSNGKSMFVKDAASYASKVNPVHMMNTHKQFRNNKQATSDAIKEYIKIAYPNFEKEWLQNFKPVLNKLLDVFNLN